MGVPYIFGNATTSIPLTNLDANFNTGLTIGNTTVGLGNTVTTLGNVTLANVTITSGTINASVTEAYGNANAVVFTNSSNVGTTNTSLTFNGSQLAIGTTSFGTSGGPLVLYNASSNPGIALQTGTSGGGFISNGVGAGLNFYTNTGAFGSESFTERMRISSAGYLGIGTTSPSAYLNVKGTDNNVMILDVPAGATYTPVYFANNGTNKAVIDWNNSSTFFEVNVLASAPLNFATAGANRMTIGSTGNVGIGTTSPSYPLDILNGTNPVLRLNSNSNSTGAQLILGSGLGTLTSTQTIYFDYQLAFSSAYVGERMRIDSNGSLNIGRTTSIYGGTGLTVQTSSNSVNCVVTSQSQSALSAVNTANGTGTSASLVSFNVGTSGGSQVGTITYDGTNVKYNATSDIRLKKNIVDAGSGLDKLANIKIRSFDWVEHDNHTDFGVVAQEIQSVAPEVVTEGQDNEDGTLKNPWMVDTSILVPAMIKAIQELKAEIDILKGNK